MKIPAIETSYIDEIELGHFESVEIRLTDGKTISVFDGTIYVKTAEDRALHRDGAKIWTARRGPRESVNWPHGQSHLTSRA